MNINIKLDEDFTQALQKLYDDYGQEVAELNGLGEKQLNYTYFIDNFIDKAVVADASIDSNANIGHKDIVSLENEMAKPHSKLLAFNKIFYELKKRYGPLVARQWLWHEWTGSFYLHDAHSASMKSYCFRGSTEIMTNLGIRRLDELVGQPIKVLNKNHGWEDATVQYFGQAPTYIVTLERCGLVKNIVCTGNHLWFADHSIYSTLELEKGMKIPFNTSRVWTQVTPSPFGVAHGFFTGDKANFCGDKIALLPYFTPATIQGDEREYHTIGIPTAFRELPSVTEETPCYLYGWLSGYFAADGCVDTQGRCTISSVNIKNLQCVRDILCVLGMPVNEIRKQDRVSNLTGELGTVYVLTLSDEYLKEDFFIRPLHKERIHATRSKKRHYRQWIVQNVAETGITEDVYCAVVPGTQSFTLTNNILTHNCYAYSLEELVNKGLFFASEFNSQPPQHLTTYTDFVSEFVSWNCNRTAGAVGLPEFLIYSYYFWRKDCQSGYIQKDADYYRDQEFQRIIYKLNQPYLRGGIQSAFTNFSIFDREYLAALFGARKFPDGSQIIDFIEDIIDYQKAFLEILSKTRHQNMMTYPVMTYALLFDDGKFVDEDFAMFCCRHNMDWADSNFFVSSDITSLSNCCRLVSNVKELGYFNSIGGTALQVGSVKVNTINLAGIAYEYSQDEYLQELRKRTQLCLQVLDVIRYIIKRNVEKGLLPNYELGIIDFNKQYNTVGIIGIYECLQEYGFTQKDEFGYTSYTTEGLKFAKEILQTIHEEIDEFACDYKINIEQIPGEQAAYKLMEKDKFFHPNKIYELPLYGNQWIPLGVKCTIEDKLYISAELDKACSGGSVAHINLDAPFKDFDTAWHFLNYVANSGVPYFAFNLRISACENNHGFFGEVCPICGGKKVTTYQRIVGFLTPEITYSEPRKREFHMRQWYEN